MYLKLLDFWTFYSEKGHNFAGTGCIPVTIGENMRNPTWVNSTYVLLSLTSSDTANETPSSFLI
jgi:hypothetical protein